MAKQNDDSHGVDKTTQQLFGPIRHLCTYVNELSKVVASKVPNHEDVAEAKRRGEFTMGQIIAVRQVENRMDVDQENLNVALKTLDGIDKDIEALQEKAEAEAATYDGLLAQTIPDIRKALTSDFKFVLNQ